MPHLEMGENPSPPYANTSLYLVPDGARPIFQILYRDTRGVEGYYTYQTQNIGNAGVGYVGDYNLQLTVVKTLMMQMGQNIISEKKLNRSSNTTFLLSEWSKGNSMPGLVTEVEENMDSTVRFWGIEVTLKYSDTSLPDDVFYLPFSDYAANWQYAAMAVTPDEADKTVASAVLKVYYHNNANKTYFDDISFIEEPAQTYTYDTEGNVKSVETSGNGEDGYEYDLEIGNLEKISYGGTTSPLTEVEYTYDKLDRVTEVEYTDSNTNAVTSYGYRYSSDGNLANILKNEELVYSYDYDTLGR